MAISSAVAAWDAGTRIRSTIASQIAAITATERLQRHGETLVSSSKLAVATGDPQYVERYRSTQAELRQAMGQLRTSIRLAENAHLAEQVDEADGNATRIELKALDLVLAGRRADANRLLEGREYLRWAAAYFVGLQKIEEHSEAFLASSQVQLQRILLVDILLSLVGLPLAALAWLFLVRPARRWGRELDEARHQAEMAAVAKSDFLASMSHEMRTPLNSIIGFTDVLLEDQSLGETQRRQVSLVHNSGNALLTVINDVLDFSKIEAGKIDIHLEPFATEALIDNSVSITRSSAEAKGLDLIVTRHPQLAKYYVGDEHRLRQVLLNLLNNAIKFTHTGSITLSVDVEQTRGAADELRVAVTDTGEGIPEEKQHRLFQSFSQADSSVTKRHGGTGLGLVISKRIIEAMGGAIGVTSKEGEGSTFWFTLSLAPAEAPAEPHREVPTLEAVRSARILLVEDVPVNQELACAVLRKDGHEVDTADDGEEAVEAARAGIYDLILMDIQMPKMDGVEATRIIRALPPPAGAVPIIAMTANVLPEQVKQFLGAGMDDHVGKPIKQVELKAAINRALRRPPGAQAEEGTTSSEAFDPETFNKIRTLLPPERLRTHLANFDRQLADLCQRGEPAEAVEQVVHKLVSQAGMFGFTGLSDKCRELEQACRDGRELTAVFESTCLAAGEARERVAELLGELGTPNQREIKNG